MKTLLLTLSLLLVLSLTSTAQTQEEIDEALKFYPLEVGNYWVYRMIAFDDFVGSKDTTFYSIEVVADTTLVNGQDYAVLRYMNIDTRRNPHHFFNEKTDGYGNTLFYALERVEQETGEVFQWTPTDDNPFAETLIDSLVYATSSYSPTSRRWEWVEETTCLQIYPLEFLGQSTESLSCEALDITSTRYNLIKGFGLSTISSAEGDAGVEIKLVFFRDSEGNEFTDPHHVNLPPKSEIPRQATLHPNYPNPFNPSTTITFELPEASDVRLSVYGITGQLIGVLVNGNRSAGRHTVQFHAEGLSSGVYLYRLQTGDVVQTRKMLLIK